jgi:hypothetical protein
VVCATCSKNPEAGWVVFPSSGGDYHRASYVCLETFHETESAKYASESTRSPLNRPAGTFSPTGRGMG